jgi:hypothetical protein
MRSSFKQVSPSRRQYHPIRADACVEGVYDDGDAKKVSVSQTGWFRRQEDEATPQKACITVFARTGACEKKFSITGQLKVDETINTESLKL